LLKFFIGKRLLGNVIDPREDRLRGPCRRKDTECRLGDHAGKSGFARGRNLGRGLDALRRVH
jgi:hypothetical protein